MKCPFKKLAIVIAFCGVFNPQCKAYYLGDMFFGNYWQIATFHIGANMMQELNSTQDNTNVVRDMGVSVGFNYSFLEDSCYDCDKIINFDFGWRLKYLHSKGDNVTHSVGAILYFHPYPQKMIYNTAQPFSIALGGGYANTKLLDKRNAEGGYVEVGIALFKYFAINIDILYRATFYANKANLNSRATHSVSFMLNIL